MFPPPLCVALRIEKFDLLFFCQGPALPPKVLGIYSITGANLCKHGTATQHLDDNEIGINKLTFKILKTPIKYSEIPLDRNTN